MSNSHCRVCGTELLPATAFCRRCGSPATDIATGSEEPTALFSETAESVRTQRLDPRPTSPERGGLQATASSTSNSLAASGPKRRKSLMVLALIAAIAGILTVVAIVRLRRPSFPPGLVLVQSLSASHLSYPGAQSIVDMTNNDGSRTIQLQTTHSLDQVERWYQKNLSLTKTVRLTSSSVVMKYGNVTITLASEDNKTVILIKQAP